MSRIFDNNTANYMSRSSVNLGLNGATECSVAAWVYIYAAGDYRIVNKEINGLDGWNSLRINCLSASTRLIGEVDNQSLNQFPTWTLSSDVGTNVWKRILFTWKRNAITSADGIIYVDGVSTALGFAANGYSAAFTIEENTSNLYYGIRPVTLTVPFNGMIAWICVWNRQLTATEALQDFDHPTNVKRGQVSCVELNRFETTTDRDIGSIGGGMSITGTLADAPDPPIARPPASIVRPFQRWG